MLRYEACKGTSEQWCNYYSIRIKTLFVVLLLFCNTIYCGRYFLVLQKKAKIYKQFGKYMCNIAIFHKKQSISCVEFEFIFDLTQDIVFYVLTKHSASVIIYYSRRRMVNVMQWR